MTPTGFDSRDSNSMPDNDLRNSGQPRAAQSGAAGPGTGPHGAASDPELLRVVEAWPRLPAEIRAAVLALVEGGNHEV